MRPYWLGPPPARCLSRGFRGPSGAAAARHSSVSSAASSAVIGVRFGAPARDRPRVVRSFERCAGTAGRAGSAGPVDPRPSSSNPRCCATRRSLGVDGRPDASLEVSCPLQRSPATSRFCVPGGATSPAIPLRRFTRVVVLLRPWYRGRAYVASCDAPACAPATPCTHAPATLAVLAVLRLAKLARSTLRGSTPRVLAGTPRRLVAPLQRTRPSPPRVMRRRFLVQPAFRYPRFGSRGLVGPLFGGRSFLGFPSRERGRQRGRSVVTRVTVSLSTPFARRRSWGFPDLPSQV